MSLSKDIYLGIIIKIHIIVWKSTSFVLLWFGAGRLSEHDKPKQHKTVGEINIIYGHDDVIKWKHFPCYWPCVRGIHRSPVNSPHKGQWRRVSMFALICAWVNNGKAGALRRHRAHYDFTVKVCVTWVYIVRDCDWESWEGWNLNPFLTFKREKHQIFDTILHHQDVILYKLHTHFHNKSCFIVEFDINMVMEGHGTKYPIAS